MSNYQPKINPEALVAGYTGADPRIAGTMRGYLERQTPEVPRSAQPQKPKGVRENPYIKK